MLKKKIAISILIFSCMFIGAWMANEKWNHFNQIPWSIPNGDVRILHHTDNTIHEPFRPREYIRIMKSKD